MLPEGECVDPWLGRGDGEVSGLDLRRGGGTALTDYLVGGRDSQLRSAGLSTSLQGSREACRQKKEPETMALLSWGWASRVAQSPTSEGLEMGACLAEPLAAGSQISLELS